MSALVRRTLRPVGLLAFASWLVLAPSRASAQPAPPAAPAPATPPPAAPPPEPAPTEVVVTATRSSRDPFETPVGTSVVHAVDIERHPGASTAEQLRDQPGIWGGEGMVYATPILRGLTGNQTLVMIDGVRLNNATSFAGDNRIMQTIDVASIDRIEVVRGPSSTMWGTDALGGTIHVFTRPPPAWPEQGVSQDARVSATLGSVDGLQRYRGEVGVATPDIRVRAGITSLSVGDLATAGPLGVMSPSGWGGRGLDARIDVRMPRRDVLTLEAQDMEVRGAQAYELSYSRPLTQDETRRLVLLRYEHAPSEGGRGTQRSLVDDWQAWTAVQQQREVTHQLADGKDLETEVVTVSTDVQAHSRLASNVDATYGLHGHVDLARSVNSSGPARTRSFPDGTWMDGAAFASVDARPVKWLSVMPAVRADVFRLHTSPDAESVPAGLGIDALRVDDTRVAPTGSLGLVARATDWMNVVASGAHGFRAPNLSDEVSSGPFRTGYNYPSPGLLPESSWTLEGGLRFKVPRWLRAEVSAWYTFLRDQITSVPRNPNLHSSDCVDVNQNGVCDANEHVYVKTNVGRAHNLGVEGSATVHLPHHISPHVVATWMTARQDDNDQPVFFLPPANATVGVRFEPKRFYVEPYVRLVAPVSAHDIPCFRLFSDGAFHVDPRDPKSPLLGTLQLSADGKTCSGSFPGYGTVSVRAGATLTSFADLEVEVRNLTNTAYRDEVVRYDGPAFGAFGTLTLHEAFE
jgi:outer membrane receptor protein involved in Fe transport